MIAFQRLRISFYRYESQTLLIQQQLPPHLQLDQNLWRPNSLGFRKPQRGSSLRLQKALRAE